LKTELWPPHGWFAWERSVLFSSSVCPVNNRKCLIIVASPRETLRESKSISSSDRLGFMHHWIKRSVVVVVVATWKIWTWQQICLSTYLTLSTFSPTCNATQAFVFSKYISYLWPWLPSSWPFFYCCLHKHFVAVAIAFCFVLFVYLLSTPCEGIYLQSCLQSSSQWCLFQFSAVDSCNNKFEIFFLFFSLLFC